MATAKATAAKPTATPKKPVCEIRMGRIKAAIWENQTAQGLRHNVSITRIYKDGTQWKDSASFGRDDLPLVEKVAQKAHDWIFEQGVSSSYDSAEDN